MKALIIIYDNNSKTNTFPLGSAYIASILRREGFEIWVWENNIYHQHLSVLEEHIELYKPDIVCMGTVAGYYQYQKLIEISESINRCRNRQKFKYILGGHGVSADPEYFINLTGADSIVCGEGERGILKAIEGKRIVKEKEIKNLDEISWPAYSLFQIEHYVLNHFIGLDRADRVMLMESGRGCPYKCNFCYRMMKGYRPRSVESVVNEIQMLKEDYNITAIYFCDELLMYNNECIQDICEEFIDERLDIKWWCNGRLNFASEKNLKLMRRAGCVFINYGIESISDKVLENMNKKLTVKQIMKGVKTTKKVGIKMGLNIIWGNYGDTLKTLKKGRDFIKKYSDGSQLRTIRPVTPYPGSPLFFDAIKKGLIKDTKDFYKKHVNSDLMTVNFTNVKDDIVYKELKYANDDLIRDYYRKNRNIALNQCWRFYNDKDVSFRGFRSI
jgi:radical SAM superfamily enzyme YgiQ (UPF0313 family)